MEEMASVTLLMNLQKNVLILEEDGMVIQIVMIYQI